MIDMNELNDQAIKDTYNELAKEFRKYSKKDLVHILASISLGTIVMWKQEHAAAEAAKTEETPEAE